MVTPVELQQRVQRLSSCSEPKGFCPQSETNRVAPTLNLTIEIVKWVACCAHRSTAHRHLFRDSGSRSSGLSALPHTPRSEHIYFGVVLTAVQELWSCISHRPAPARGSYRYANKGGFAQRWKLKTSGRGYERLPQGPKYSL